MFTILDHRKLSEKLKKGSVTKIEKTIYLLIALIFVLSPVHSFLFFGQKHFPFSLTYFFLATLFTVALYIYKVHRLANLKIFLQNFIILCVPIFLNTTLISIGLIGIFSTFIKSYHSVFVPLSYLIICVFIFSCFAQAFKIMKT